MQSEHTSIPSFSSSINIDQWRQDIQTFADTTRQMLESINDELSNGLAQKVSEVSSEAQPRIENQDAPVIHQELPVADSTDSVAEKAVSRAATESVEENCDQLLANLKKQLAQQLDHS